MANLKEVRTRIASVKSTRQITSAMKMVAAAKLRKAQNSILALRPYASKLHEIMGDLSSSVEGSNENVFAAQREVKNVLLIPVTSNRGLCGAFNINVVKETVNLVENQFAGQYAKGNLHLYCIGKKGADLLKTRGFKIKAVNVDIFDKLTFENSVSLAGEFMNGFKNGEYDKVIIIYNRFKNAAVQILETEQFLPVVALENNNGNKKTHTNADYIFEPGKEEILGELIPKSLKVQLYKVLIDSFAAEHGARMTAMHKATDNADELLKELKLSYNKARQAAITNEILEIVSGAEALKG
jgi:F-type H+-transporting ATPase subunit gamma